MQTTTEKLTRVSTLKDKKIAVLGFGERTGLALCRFLLQNQAKVWLYDKKSAVELGENLKQLSHHLASTPMTKSRLTVKFGKLSDNDFGFLKEMDWIIASPGIPLSEPVMIAASHANRPLVGELEFSSWMVQAPIIAVTGTNGKSTTCALIAQMLKLAGKKVFLGGNYGNPLVNAIGHSYDTLVIEASSYQLETIATFHPKIAVLLNISPDHLERHQNLEAYAKIKGHLFANMKSSEIALISQDDPWVVKAATNCVAQKLSIAADSALATRYDWSQTSLKGEHNLQNLRAMAAVGESCGLEVKTIQKAIAIAKAPPHRLEAVGIHQGVSYINDSKSTTPDSTVVALKALTKDQTNRAIILILGGKDKGLSYNQLSLALDERIKAIVAYGEAAKRMQKEIVFAGKFIVELSFDRAVTCARNLASSGDCVLLSPATASFDQFKNFEARGERFVELVNRKKSHEA